MKIQQQELREESTTQQLLKQIQNKFFAGWCDPA